MCRTVGACTWRARTPTGKEISGRVHTARYSKLPVSERYFLCSAVFSNASFLCEGNRSASFGRGVVTPFVLSIR